MTPLLFAGHAVGGRAHDAAAARGRAHAGNNPAAVAAQRRAADPGHAAAAHPPDGERHHPCTRKLVSNVTNAVPTSLPHLVL